MPTIIKEHPQFLPLLGAFNFLLKNNRIKVNYAVGEAIASKPGATPTAATKTKGITFVNNKLLLKNHVKNDYEHTYK